MPIIYAVIPTVDVIIVGRGCIVVVVVIVCTDNKILVHVLGKVEQQRCLLTVGITFDTINCKREYLVA